MVVTNDRETNNRLATFNASRQWSNLDAHIYLTCKFSILILILRSKCEPIWNIRTIGKRDVPHLRGFGCISREVAAIEQVISAVVSQVASCVILANAWVVGVVVDNEWEGNIKEDTRSAIAFETIEHGIQTASSANVAVFVELDVVASLTNAFIPNVGAQRHSKSLDSIIVVTTEHYINLIVNLGSNLRNQSIFLINLGESEIQATRSLLAY